jgi:hypothetical protein
MIFLLIKIIKLKNLFILFLLIVMDLKTIYLKSNILFILMEKEIVITLIKVSLLLI